MFNDYEEIINDLNNAEAGALIKAVFAFVCGKPEPKMSKVVKMAYSIIKAQIARNNESYDKVLEMKSKAGKKSAEVKAKNKQKATKSTPVESVEHNSTKSTINGTGTINKSITGTEKVNGNGIQKQPPHTTKAYSNLKYFEEHQGFSITPEPSEALRETFDRYLLGRALGQHGPIQSYVQIEEILRGFADRDMNEETIIKVLKANIKNGWKNIQYNAVEEEQKTLQTAAKEEIKPQTWN